MSRWKAASIHLAMSAAIIAAVALGLIFMWYGWALFGMMGGAKLLLILAAVDIVIGPLLTLIVFKSGKPSLKFDLGAIAVLQVCFLAYGLHMMWASRPVYMVGVKDRFELVFANEVDPVDLADATAPYDTLPWGSPKLIGVVFPTDSNERLALIQAGIAGKDIHLVPRYYADYSSSAASLEKEIAPAEELAAQSDAVGRQNLEAAVAGSGLAASDVGTLPIVSRRGRATMLVNRQGAVPVGPIAVEPWPELISEVPPASRSDLLRQSD